MFPVLIFVLLLRVFFVRLFLILVLVLVLVLLVAVHVIVGGDGVLHTL